MLRFAVPALLVAAQWAVAATSVASAIHETQPLPPARAPGLVPVKTDNALAQRALSQSSD